MRRFNLAVASVIAASSIPFAIASVARAAPTIERFEIAVGDEVSDGAPEPGAGNLEVGEAVDEYRFDATTGEALILDVLAGSAGTFRWTLAAPSGAVILDHALFLDSEHDAAETGTYVLSVSGAAPTSTGTYAFRLLAAPPAEQFVIAIGDTVGPGVPAAGAGEIETPGAQDVYTFDAVTGQTIIADHISGSNVLLGWRLTAPDGTVQFDGVFGDRAVAVSTSGAYTLTVRGNGIDDTGTYSYRLLAAPEEERFAIAIGDEIASGVPAPGAGEIETPGARDVYTFDAVTGQTIIADHITGSNVLLGWTLTAPDGTVLYDQHFSDQQTTAPTTGTYTLTVRGNSIDDTGSYSFRLLADPLTEVFAIAIGDEVTPGVPAPGAGEIETPGARDVYTFDAVTGQTIIADHITGSNVLLGWTLTAPDGTVLYDQHFSDQQTTAPTTGTYTLTVRGNSIDDTGSYSFQLLDAPPPNHPPTIEAIGDCTDTEGDTVSVPVVAGDPDAEPVALSATGLPDGIALDHDHLTGTLADGSAAGGPYVVEITATDPHGATAVTSFVWTIEQATTPVVTADVEILAPLHCLGLRSGVAIVVVHGSPTVDVRAIDIASLRLGALPVARLFGIPLAAYAHVDGDGVIDLVALFHTRRDTFDDTGGAAVTGTLRDGTSFAGSDRICDAWVWR